MSEADRAAQQRADEISRELGQLFLRERELERERAKLEREHPNVVII